MADKITWMLGADASQVRAEMTSAIASVNAGTSGMVTGFSKVDAAHSKLLRSGRAVAGQITNLSRDLLSGASAGQVFANSFEAIGRSLNLSLASLTALGLGSLGVGKVHEVIVEYRKLNEEIDKLTAPRASANFQQLQDLETHLNTASTKLEELRGQGGAKESGFGWLKDVFRMWGADGSQKRPDETMYGMVKRQRQEKIGALEESGNRDRGDMAIKFQHRTDIREAALDGEAPFITKARGLKAATDEMPHNTQQAVIQAMTELSLGLREMAKSVSEKRAERSGMSLQEIAATPETTMSSDGISYEQWMAGKKARQALDLKAQGEAARINFQPDKANSLFNQSGEVAEGITNLKPSEKMAADFKGALSVTESYLQELVQNRVVLVNK